MEIRYSTIICHKSHGIIQEFNSLIDAELMQNFIENKKSTDQEKLDWHLFMACGHLKDMLKIVKKHETTERREDERR